MDLNFSQPNWKSIISDIDKERAILLLGPDFLPHSGLSVLADFHDFLTNHYDDDRITFFFRDGMFLFDEAVDKMEAQTGAEEFYNNLSADEAVLSAIAELPFPLIVSVNPDQLLPQFFAKRMLSFQFDYFSIRDKAIPSNITKPTATSPLIFNLLGSVEDYQSLILDFDDMFELLKKLLGDFSIPKVVNDTMINATTYIFIGFQFEKWYTQMLLRYVNKNRDRFTNTKKNFAIKTVISEENTRNFFQKQFNLNVYGADLQFLHDLRSKYADSDKLRVLQSPISDNGTIIRRLILVNDLKEALKQLLELTAGHDNAIHNEAIMYNAEYHAWQKERSEGTVTQESLDVKIAKVRKGILELSQRLS